MFAEDGSRLELAQYVLVLTTLPAKFSASQVLQLYRCRRQVELAFKRLKSLLGAGHVPKSDDQSARAWMQAKILTALFLERLLLEAKIFSPWGYELVDTPEPVA
jgi:IS4 transposase